MKRLLKSGLTLGDLLTARSSPKISDVKVKFVDNAHKITKRLKRKSKISTRTPINGDVLNQD